MKHHLIVSGTGRAGTTFLIQLFTALGYDTGFSESETRIDQEGHAGLERDIREPGAPYIVKTPYLCDYLEKIMRGGHYVIDHAFVPIRDLFSAAESRRAVSRHSPGSAPDTVGGGIWETFDPAQQEAVLTQKLYNLLYALALSNIPLTLLHFPRLVQEPAYLYRKLRPVFPDLHFETFFAQFLRTVQPQLVHTYRKPELPSFTQSVQDSEFLATTLEG